MYSRSCVYIAGARKSLPDTQYHVPASHKCPAIDDWEVFSTASLHDNFRPKPNPLPATSIAPVPTGVTLKYTNSPTARALSTEVLTETGVASSGSKCDGKCNDIDDYRNNKLVNGGSLSESKSLQDLQTKEHLERSNTYLKFKRYLKFSTKDRRTGKAEDEEDDEGYSSKTSSAEPKGDESEGEEGGAGGDGLSRGRMFSSMMDLSDVTADPGGLSRHPAPYSSRAKFSYTHQAPHICQLPGPDVALGCDNLRVDTGRKTELEDSSWSYSMLKRNKELNRSYTQDFIQTSTEESTVYNLDNIKPMTLILRKISIQNAEQGYPTIYHTEMQPTCIKAQPCDPRQASRASNHSRAVSRAESAHSPDRQSPCRADSAMSQIGSRISSPRSHSRGPTMSRRSDNAPTQTDPRYGPGSYTRKGRSGKASGEKQKEGMWSQEFSYIDKNSSAYSIGDLLPAMDKNIYTNTGHTPRFVGSEEPDTSRTEMTNVEMLDQRSAATEDGYLLLRKGLDILARGHDKVRLSAVSTQLTNRKVR